MAFNRWIIFTAYLLSVGISYGESLPMTSLSANVKSIDEEQREPLAGIVPLKKTTVIVIDISIDRTSGPAAQTTIPLIAASFVSFATHEISINTRHEVIEEEVNGMANLKFTCPCLEQGSSAYTGDLQRPSLTTFKLYNRIFVLLSFSRF